MNQIIEETLIENRTIIIIDIEELSKTNQCHPENDPGVIIHYRIKVDDQYLEMPDRHILCKALLEKVGKNPENFYLEQFQMRHGQIHFLKIGLDQIIDFGTPGIECFVTKVKTYNFFIDKKEFVTDHSRLTVKQILVDYGQVDPSENTLAQRESGGFKELKDLNQEVSLEDCPHFTIFNNAPTPVS